jgi:hypothetical protein
MKQFDLYDILGFLAPGTITILGVLHYYPQKFTFLRSTNLSVGEFGAVVLLAYIAGNLVAGVSTLLAKWNLFGGFPTNEIKCDNATIISHDEFGALEKALREKNILKPEQSIKTLPEDEWYAATRKIHSYLDARGLTRRVEMFNAKFGMNRNLVVAFLLLIPISMWKVGLADWKIDIVLGACAGCAIYRLREFAILYAQTLIRVFLVAPEKPTCNSTASDGE